MPRRILRRPTTMVTTFLLFAALLAPQSAPGNASIAPPEPTAANYRAWIDAIVPDATELAYLDVGWRNAFWPAVQEAKALGRPILFWTMNGHPLGCT
jgi:hypothetical protein